MAVQAERGGGGTAPTHSQPGTRRGGWSAPLFGRPNRGKNTVPTVQESRMGSGLDGAGV
jgi:hypothetical protein